ncbi:minor tail protein [Mycobacterium phage Steamy]|uniref:Minor tail protein n=1 Tax=Mycobacterium phage Steamy TaxID=2250309 RepID=A0A345L0K4_9CAUD|nr:minor tail protein [Mycobacterium phage Steamy]AXH48806.1 minor tail protein [Mycobacterium phage Steamy]
MTYRFVPNFALRVVQIALLVEAIIRGLNYMATPSDYSPIYSAAEQSAPLWVWGWLFITAGVLGLAGEAWMSSNGSSLAWNYRAWPSFVSHIGLMSLFVAFALSSGAGVISREPLYGFISPADFMFFAVAHWAFARRRKHV